MRGQTEQPDLATLQRWIAWAITDSRGVELALSGKEPCAQELEPTPRCFPAIAETPSANRVQRLTIYADAYLLRIVEVFKLDYKAVQTAVGEQAFIQLISDYLERYPSTSPNIAEISRYFSGFLKTYEPLSDRAFLPELAELEWRINESFYADDLPAFDVRSLMGVPESAWGQLRFQLDSSVQLFETKWPVYGLWKKARDGADGAFTLPTRPRCERLLIFRDAEGTVQVQKVEKAFFETIRGLSKGQTLSEVSLSLAREIGDRAIHQIQTWFQSCVRDGIIRKVVLP